MQMWEFPFVMLRMWVMLTPFLLIPTLFCALNFEGFFKRHYFDFDKLEKPMGKESNQDGKGNRTLSPEEIACYKSMCAICDDFLTPTWRLSWYTTCTQLILLLVTSHRGYLRVHVHRNVQEHNRERHQESHCHSFRHQRMLHSDDWEHSSRGYNWRHVKWVYHAGEGCMPYLCVYMGTHMCACTPGEATSPTCHATPPPLNLCCTTPSSSNSQKQREQTAIFKWRATIHFWSQQFYLTFFRICFRTSLEVFWVMRVYFPKMWTEKLQGRKWQTAHSAELIKWHPTGKAVSRKNA